MSFLAKYSLYSAASIRSRKIGSMISRKLIQCYFPVVSQLSKPIPPFRYSDVTQYHGKDLFNGRAWYSIEMGNVDPSQSAKFLFRRDREKYLCKLMSNPEKYPEVNINENFFSVNKSSTNSLLLLVRKFMNESNESGNLVEVDFGSDKFNETLCSARELMEVLYLLYKYKHKYMLKTGSDALGNLLIKNCKALGNLSIEEKLSLTYLIGVNIGIFRRKFFINKIRIRSFEKLTNAQLVQYFYSLHKWKTITEPLNYENVLSLVQRISEISLSELIIILNWYISCKIRGPSGITEKVLLRCLEEIENVNDIELAIICQFLNISLAPKQFASHVHQLYDKCIEVLSKFTLTNCIHLCSIGLNAKIGNTELIRRTLEMIEETQEDVKLTDLQRLLLATVFFNYELKKDSSIIKFFLKKLEEKTREGIECRLYPNAYLNYLECLIIHGIFPEDKVSFVLSESFRALLDARFKMKKFHQLVFFDAVIELERPDYKGNRLDPALRKQISEKIRGLYYMSGGRRYFLNEIKEELTRMYGDGSAVVTRLMPQFATEFVVLCLNGNNEGQEIGDALRAPHQAIVRAPSDGNRWICLVFLPQKECLEDRITPNFISLTKLKHLQTAGFVPISIPTSVLFSKKGEVKSEYLGEVLHINDFCSTTSEANS